MKIHQNSTFLAMFITVLVLSGCAPSDLGPARIPNQATGLPVEYPALPTFREAVTLTPSPTITPPPSPTMQPTMMPNTAKVKLITGETKTLSGPSMLGKLVGFPPCPDLVLNNVKLSNIQSIRRTTEDGLEIQAGDSTLVVLPGDASLISATSNDKILLKDVQEVTFEGGLSEEYLPTGVLWEIWFACGQKLQFDNIVGDFYTSLIGHYGAFELKIRPRDLASIVRPAGNPEILDLTARNGAILSGITIGADFIVRGKTIFGEIQAPWKDVYLAQVVHYSPDILPTSYPQAQRVWHINTEDGISINAANLVIVSGQIDSLTVSDTNIDVLEVVQITENGRISAAIDSSSTPFTITDATIQGNMLDFPAEFTIHSRNLSTLSTENPAIPLETNPEGNLSLKTGITWQVNNLEFSGGQPEHGSYGADSDEIEDSLQLTSQLWQYWVTWDRLRAAGFTNEGGIVSLPCQESESCPSGTTSGSELSFEYGPFTMKTSLSNIAGFAPLETPPEQAINLAWKITVTGQDGTSQQVFLEDLSFARYPATCWTGMYQAWPFHWYKNQTLDVTKADGSQLNIPFNEIKLIGFPDACQIPTCPVRVTYTSGSSINASLYPGSTNEDNKKGPASWTSADEGLLGHNSEGVLVFIPFLNVASIEIQTLQVTTPSSP